MGITRALRAATLGSADILGVAEDVGSVEAGKIADMVILNSDPRADIRRTIDVYRVMKGGHLYDPVDLANRMPKGFGQPAPSAAPNH